MSSLAFIFRIIIIIHANRWRLLFVTMEILRRINADVALNSQSPSTWWNSVYVYFQTINNQIYTS